MADQNELERLYREAQSALKAKEYNRAAGLLTQIVVIDEDYKDTSRLLAQTVKLKRRRWYNDVRIWGTVFGAVVIGLLIWIVPKLSLRATPDAEMVNPTGTAISTNRVTPTITPTPMPTPIPLTWKRVSIGQEFERDKIIAFEIDPKDPDVLYASMENAGYYQSIDGGISWRPVQIENDPADISTKLIANNDHNQDEGYTVSNIGPDGKMRLYRRIKGTSNWRVSEDNGQTWGEFGIMGRPASAAITFDSNGSVYAYCNSHLCKYSSDGELISTLGEPDVGAFTIISISSYDPNTIYITGRGMAASKDGGLTWLKINNGLGAILLTLETGEGNPPTLYLQVEKCDNFNFPYITRSNPVPEPGQPVYISNNGGQTWELVIQTGCYLIKDADGVTLYRIGRAIEFSGNGYLSVSWVWRSQDEGKLWEKVGVPTSATTLTADSAQSGLLYLYLDYDRGEGVNYHQYISEDHGHKWRAKDPEVSVRPCYGSTLQFIDTYRPMAIDPRDGNHVFVIDNGALLESRDSCKTTSAFGTAPNTSMNSIAFDPNKPDILYAGTDDGAYVSFDGGVTWGQVNDGLLGATVVYSIVVDKESNVYAATPYGVFKLENK